MGQNAAENHLKDIQNFELHSTTATDLSVAALRQVNYRHLEAIVITLGMNKSHLYKVLCIKT